MIVHLLAGLAFLLAAVPGGALAQPSALSVDSRLLLPYPSCPDPAIPGDLRYGVWDVSANGGRGGWGCTDHLNGRFSDINLELNKIEAAITDPTPVLSVSDARASASDNTISFRVRLFNNSSGAVASFSYETADYTAHGGTDFMPLSGSASVSDSTTIVVPLLGADHPNPVAFHLRLTGAAGASIADGDAIGLIAPTPAPQLSISDVYVNRTAGVATLMVTRSGSSHAISTVAWQTVDGTAQAGTDYVAASGTLIFPAGTTSVPVPVALIPGAPIGIRKFHVVLSNPTGTQIADGSGDATIVTMAAPESVLYLPQLTLQLSEPAVTHYRNTGDIPLPITAESPRTITGGWVGPLSCPIDPNATASSVMSDALVRQLADTAAYWYTNVAALTEHDESYRAHAAMSIGGAPKTICHDDGRVHLDQHPEGGDPATLWSGKHPNYIIYPDGRIGMSVDEFKQMSQQYSPSLYNQFYRNTNNENQHSWFDHFFMESTGHIAYPFLSTRSPPLPALYEDAIPFVWFGKPFSRYENTEKIELTRQRIEVYRNCTLNGGPPLDTATHCPWPRP